MKQDLTSSASLHTDNHTHNYQVSLYPNLNHLHTIVVNFQSIVPKKADLSCVIDSVNPDILIGTQTWLSPSISSSEFFLSGYTVYRNDR